MPLLERQLERNVYLDWSYLSQKPYALPLLEKHPDKIDWEFLSFNPSALHLLEANLDKIDWIHLTTNLGAIPLLKANLDKFVPVKDAKINWSFLFTLRSGPPVFDDLTLHCLSCNPNAIDLLEELPEEIDWDNLSQNRNAARLICKLDLEKMTENALPLKEELIAYLYNPDRLARVAKQMGLDMRALLAKVHKTSEM